MYSHDFTRIASIELLVEIFTLLHPIMIILGVTWSTMQVFVASFVLSSNWNRLLLHFANKEIWVKIVRLSQIAHITHTRMSTASDCSFSLVLLARQVLLLLVFISIWNYFLQFWKEAASIQVIIVSLLVNSASWLAYAVWKAICWIVVRDKVLS